MLNFINNSVPVGKFSMSAEINFFTFNWGSVWEFPNVSRPLMRPGNSKSRMSVLSWDREDDIPECSVPGISRIFLGNIWFPGNGIRERRPLKCASQYNVLVLCLKCLYIVYIDITRIMFIFTYLFTIWCFMLGARQRSQ